MINFVNGEEHHSSSWGKFYVKGLERDSVKEDFPENRIDGHHRYQGYCALNVPAGTIFTIFEQSGSKRGTERFYFYIVLTIEDDGSVEANSIIKADYGAGFVEGAFTIIAEASGKIKSPRLMRWWNEGDQSLAYAEHCKKWIEKRGIDQIPPME